METENRRKRRSSHFLKDQIEGEIKGEEKCVLLSLSLSLFVGVGVEGGEERVVWFGEH